MRRFALIVLILLGSCASYRPVDAFVIGLAPAESGALEQRVRIDLRLQNPNDRPLVVHGMRVDLDLNGQRLARGVSNAHFTVPALGEATTSITTSTSLFDLARQATVLSGRTTMDYALSGVLFVDGVPGSVNFHQKGRIGGVNQKRTGALQ
jgi:LEA14-like dessication related protein